MKRAMRAKQEELRAIEEERDRLQEELVELKSELADAKTGIPGNVFDQYDGDKISDFEFGTALLQELEAKEGER